MKKQHIGVIVKARNEEKFIGIILEHLTKQSLPPYKIILVDDGSTDKTVEIALSFLNVEIVNRKTRGEHYATSEMSRNVNMGLEKFVDDNCDYIMILDSDIVLPKDYLEQIVTRMNTESKLVISSGIVEGEYSSVPRGGAGRVIKYEFWKHLGLCYPENIGYEGYLIYKAESLGYSTDVFDDLIMKTLRKTGSKYNLIVYKNIGKGYKALGYTIPFIFVHALRAATKSPLAWLYLLSGYFSNYDKLYEKELRDYVKKSQYKRIKKLRINDAHTIFKTFFHT